MSESNREIDLGVVFSGRPSPSLLKTIQAIKDAVLSLDSVMAKTTESMRTHAASYSVVGKAADLCAKNVAVYNAELQKGGQASAKQIGYNNELSKSFTKLSERQKKKNQLAREEASVAQTVIDSANKMRASYTESAAKYATLVNSIKNYVKEQRSVIHAENMVAAAHQRVRDEYNRAVSVYVTVTKAAALYEASQRKAARTAAVVAQETVAASNKVRESYTKSVATYTTVVNAIKNYVKEQRSIIHAQKQVQTSLQQSAAIYVSTVKAAVAMSQQTRASLLQEAQAHRKLVTAIKAEGGSVQSVTGKYSKLIQAMDAGTMSVNQMQQAYLKLRQASGRDVYKKQITNTKKATTATKTYNTALQALGRSFKTLASYMVAGRAIMLFTTGLMNGVKEIANFDQALKNLQAITGATDAQIAGMSKTLIELAKTTKFSTTELAQGMVLLGQSGFDASESMDAIKSASTLATGTLSSMAVTADLLTTSIRAYNLDAIESTRVSDVMANAVNKSKLTIDKLRTAFNYVGVTASQAGLSLEQTTATMMVLANNGLRASSIGTGLRQVLGRLIAPTAKLRQAFADQNIEIEKINPSIVGYENSIKELSKVLWDTEKDTVNMGKAFQLFGLRGAQAAAVLVKSYAGVGEQFQSALEKVREVGTASKMAEKQATGLAVMWKNMKDNVGTLALALGESGLLGAFKFIVVVMREIVHFITSMLSTTLGSLVTTVALVTSSVWGLRTAWVAMQATAKGAAVWGAVTFFFTELGAALALVAEATTLTAGAFTLLSTSVTAVGATLGALFSPLTIIIGTITAASVVLYRLVTQRERHLKSIQGEIVTLDRVIKGYSLYSKALSSLEKEQKQGIDTTGKQAALIVRLKKEYPELAEEIDKNVGSAADLVKMLDKLSKQKEAERIKKLITSYGILSTQTRSLSESIAEALDIHGKYTRLFVSQEQEMQTASKKQAKELLSLVSGIQAYGKAQGMSKEQTMEFAEQMALSSNKSKEFATTLKNKVGAAIDAVAKRHAAFVAQMKQEELFQLPTFDFSDILGEFDSFEKAMYNKTVESTKRTIVEIKNRYRTILGMEREQNIEIQNARIALMDKIAEIGRTDLTTDAQIYQKKSDNLRKFVSQTELQQKRALTAINDYEKESLADNEKQYKAKLISQEDYDKAVLSITQQGADRRLKVQEQFVGQQLANISALKTNTVSMYKEATAAVIKSYETRFKGIGSSYEQERATLEEAHAQKMADIKSYVVEVSDSENVILAETIRNAEAKKAIAQEYWSTITKLHKEAFAEGAAVDSVGLEQAALERDVEMQKLEEFHKKRLSLIEQNSTEILSIQQQQYAETDHYLQVQLSAVEEFTRASTIAAQERRDAELQNLDGLPISEQESVNERTRIEEEFTASMQTINAQRLTDYKKLMDNLLSEEDKLTASIEKYQQANIKAEDNLAKFEHKLSREKLTAKQKYFADIKRAKELQMQALQELEAGDTERAASLYKQSFDLSKTLGKEITETQKVLTTTVTETDKTVKGHTRTIRKLKKEYKDKKVVVVAGAQAEKTALELAKAATKGLTAANDKAAANARNRLKTIKEQYAQLEAKVTEYKNSLDKIKDVEIKMDVDPAIAELSKLIEKLEKAVKLQAKLNSTKATKTDDKEQSSSTVPDQYFGGAYAEGGEVGGVDKGNDSQYIKARPGEWVIKNDAVNSWQSEFGSKFMSGINNPLSETGQKISGALRDSSFLEKGKVMVDESFLSDMMTKIASAFPSPSVVEKTASSVAINFGKGALAPTTAVVSKTEALLAEIKRAY